jgi:hypothetical protein
MSPFLISCVYNFKIRTHGIAVKNIIIPVGDFLIMAISSVYNLFFIWLRRARKLGCQMEHPV